MKAFLCFTEQTAAKMCLQQVVVVWFYWQDVASGGKVCKVPMRKGGKEGSHGKKQEKVYLHLHHLGPASLSITLKKCL